jgi:hypothetical protein
MDEGYESTGAGIDIFRLKNRDLAGFVLSSEKYELLDYDLQLIAIRNLLRRNRLADEEVRKEIAEAEAFARTCAGNNDREIEQYIEHLQYSTFQDAAHSTAAFGMLAPFIESLFKRAFPGIRELLKLNGRVPSLQARSVLPEDKQWDCQYASATPGSKHLVAGIIEMAEVTGLAANLPIDLESTLTALFGYRNKIFHCGFEW